MEIRTFASVDVRAGQGVSGSGPGVTLQVIKPNVVDDYGSLWNAHAFDESLSTRLPVLCWAHDWANPLGPGVDYTPSNDGPRVRFAFSDFNAVPQARRAHAQVKDGTIRDCSVGFSKAQRREPTAGERSKYPGVREVIEKSALDEVSLVLSGAVPGAQVVDVRSSIGGYLGAPTIDRAELLRIRRMRQRGQLTDSQAHAALERVARTYPNGNVAVSLRADAEIDAALAIARKYGRA